MKAYLLQEGCCIDYTPTSAVSAGDVVFKDNRIAGVAPSPIAANVAGSICIGGIFSVTAASGVTFLVGESVYWDISAGTAINFGSIDTGDFYIGIATEAKVSGTTAVKVMLNAPKSRGLRYCSTAASTAITNTTTETAFDKNFTFPANSLKAGDVIRVRYQGIATATNSTDTLTIKLYVGGTAGTAILVGTATDVANNNIFGGEAQIVIRTTGASGTFVAVGTHIDVPAASGTATQAVAEITASTTIDTTATLQICAAATWSVASTSDSCRLDIFSVEQIGG